jgi:CoA:oxalate CoA-transferase
LQYCFHFCSALADSSHCLSGIKVVDLTQVIAGPYAAMQLATLGANVVKVESPEGDPMRWRGGNDEAAAAQGLSTHYQAHARGRIVKYLDWTTDAGIAALKSELQDADGLSDETLRKAFPRLVVCKLSGYSDNESSECANWPAYDNTIQAASGLMRLSGATHEGSRIGAPILDYAAGMASVSAILAALFERVQSGAGQVVKVNMLAVAHQLTTAQRFDMAHTGVEPTYKGNRANSGEPLSMVFETLDGYLALAVNEVHQFAKLALALEDARISSDLRFATRASRRWHSGELQAAVQAALHRRSALDWEQRLNDAGIAAAAVRTLAQSVQHPGAESDPALFRMERGAKTSSALPPASAFQGHAASSTTAQPRGGHSNTHSQTLNPQDRSAHFNEADGTVRATAVAAQRSAQ